ncbi:hypothetical protein CDD82_3479 [Ophiocordyceps australis]|uniref:WSC domain-containing protein n=1 Tax=Ophiocordyceps australis TaxID=1399860 RepID=A0A2C5ZDM4_9HYPO|nr:hypothetical protein CDD82_3479 [Ophiocordyceps australis]
MRASWRLVALALVAAADDTAQTNKTVVGSYTLQGCWTEATDSRALIGDAMASDGMTLEVCAQKCSGFIYFGAEYGRECYCGDSLQDGSVKAKHQQDCFFPCAGDASEYCGGSQRLQLYRRPSVTTPPIPLPTNSSSGQPPPTSSLSVPPTGPIVWPGNAQFDFYSCVSEPSKGRLLASQVLNDGDNMTVERCLEACDSYEWAGVEYGRECWCDDKLNWAGDGGATPARNVSQAECNMPCPGDRSVSCGGGLRLSLYSSKSSQPPGRVGEAVDANS